jgi:hypothetical protein
MHDAPALLLSFGKPGAFDTMPWAEHLKSVNARYEAAWHLPVVGKVSAPGAVLIRPDGHVAWAGDRSDDGLERVLAGWFGDCPSA